MGTLYPFVREYVVVHTWNFSDGSYGRYEVSFKTKAEAMERFNDFQKLISTDEYDFDAIIPEFHDGDTSYSIYEKVNSLVNRQDLVLFVREV